MSIKKNYFAFWLVFTVLMFFPVDLAQATPGPYCPNIVSVIQKGSNLKVTLDIDNSDDDVTVYRIQVVRSSDNVVMYDSQILNCDDNTQVNCIYNPLLGCKWSDSTNVHGVVCSDPMVVTVPAPSPGDYYIKAGVDDSCIQCCSAVGISGCEGNCPDSAVIKVVGTGCGDGIINGSEVCDKNGDVGCAAPTPACKADCSGCIGCTLKSNFTFLGKPVICIVIDATKWILSVAGSLILLILILSGIYYMVSGENPKRQESAKKMISYTTVGIVLILVSYAVITLIDKILAQS